eukprot:359295-Chlamydomonas_euryale.AAC.4
MVDSCAADGTEKRQRRPTGSMGRLVRIGNLSTACRLADVLIHTRQPAKRFETQCRPACRPARPATQRRPAPESSPHRPKCP